MQQRQLILASTSPYRRELLTRFGVPFETAAPECDEQCLPGESPVELALRLAKGKAESLAIRFPDALIIGSDQVAYLGEEIFGKPGNHANAVRQLRAMSGHCVDFFTALCVYDSAQKIAHCRGVMTQVTFRQLSERQIENYLQREQPYNCAGAAKSEGLGIALIARISGNDPNALIGLPLIVLNELLLGFGFDVLNY